MWSDFLWGKKDHYGLKRENPKFDLTKVWSSFKDESKFDYTEKKLLIPFRDFINMFW